MVLGLVLVCGCAPLLDKLHGSDSTPQAPTDGRGDLVDSLTIADGKLWFDFDTEHIFHRYDDDGVRFVLDGPNGIHERFGYDYEGSSTIVWKDEWPAGTYTLTFTWFSRPLDHRQFEVKMIPSVAGSAKPYIARTGLPPVVYSPHSSTFHTAVLVDATSPVTEGRWVWIKGDKVLDSEHLEMRIEPISLGGPLAEMKHLDGNAVQNDGKTLTGANLYLFANDETLIGTWGYTEPSPGHQYVVLPEVTPDHKQLALVRAYVAAQNSYRDSTFDIAESVVCSAASSSQVRDAMWNAMQSGAEENAEIDRVAEKQAVQDDPRRSRADRDQARKDQSASSDWAVMAHSHGMSSIQRIKAAAKKFKKGCLVSLGVPRFSQAKKL
jgi:hypothetical protein